MSQVFGFVASLARSIALAAGVTLVLRRPLGELLVELCGNERLRPFAAGLARE